MVSKLSLFRPNSLPFPISSSHPSRFFHPSPKTLILCLFSTTTPHYGPSLLKGKKLSLDDLRFPSIGRNENTHRRNSEDSIEILNEDDFTRVFDISAIRVPAKDCFALENRLRGHLLNWPRIRNIARVPGDEIDEQVSKLLAHESEEEEEDSVVDSVDRRIKGKAEGDGERLNPVLYRDKLAKTFNSTGFVRFRNLAKISRPRRKRKTEKTEEKVKGSRRNEFAVVEVVESGEENEDFEGLLGEGYGGSRGRWRGSTRLLLLDEKYSGDEEVVQDLPQAIKVLFTEAEKIDARLSFELVKCRLTLFYDYWPMNEVNDESFEFSFLAKIVLVLF